MCQFQRLFSSKLKLQPKLKRRILWSSIVPCGKNNDMHAARCQTVSMALQDIRLFYSTGGATLQFPIGPSEFQRRAVEPDRLKKATARVCTWPPSLCLRCVTLSSRPRAWLPYKHTACICKLVILELSLNDTGKVSGATDDMTS